MLHKTLPTGTHLFPCVFMVTSHSVLFCPSIRPVSCKHSTSSTSPSAKKYSKGLFLLKNIQRVCSKVKIPVPQNMKKKTQTGGISPALGLNESTLWPIPQSAATIKGTHHPMVLSTQFTCK
jgi:hypothetical protein